MCKSTPRSSAPAASSTPSSIPQPPLSGGCCHSPEQIVVKEADFHRCGNNLKQLRERDVRRLSSESAETEQCEASPALSFKSAFARRCRQLPSDLRDPWKDLGNPEFHRARCEADMVLNQVWESTLPKAKSAAGSKEEEKCLSPWRRRKGGSNILSHVAAEGIMPRTRNLEDCDISEGGGLEEADELPGSAAVREATKAQQHGIRALECRLHYDSNPRAAWLALDTKTGEVQLYQRAVAERIEAAHRQRASVPLVGLGLEVDSAIVTFGQGDRVFAKETSLSGIEREVRRIAVPGTMLEVNVNIAREGETWRFLRDQDAQASTLQGVVIESRRVVLSPTEVIEPPPKLPTLMDRYRKVTYLNFGTELWG